VNRGSGPGGRCCRCAARSLALLAGRYHLGNRHGGDGAAGGPAATASGLRCSKSCCTSGPGRREGSPHRFSPNRRLCQRNPAIPIPFPFPLEPGRPAACLAAASWSAPGLAGGRSAIPRAWRCWVQAQRITALGDRARLVGEAEARPGAIRDSQAAALGRCRWPLRRWPTGSVSKIGCQRRAPGGAHRSRWLGAEPCAGSAGAAGPKQRQMDGAAAVWSLNWAGRYPAHPPHRCAPGGGWALAGLVLELAPAGVCWG